MSVRGAGFDCDNGLLATDYCEETRMPATNAREAKPSRENDGLLRQWELDARALHRTRDEGMIGEDPVAARKTIGGDDRLGSTERIPVKQE
jgi:hypothetical protein